MICVLSCSGNRYKLFIEVDGHTIDCQNGCHYFTEAMTSSLFVKMNGKF